LTVNSTNSNTYKFNLSSSGVVDSYFGSNNVKLFSIADKNVNELFFIDTLGKVSVNATGVPININSINNNFYKLSFSNTNSGVITSYLGSDASKSLSIANSSANEVAYITYLGDAAFNGNITEAGNNVLTNLDTVSLSSRINGKVGLTGNETITGDKTFSSRVNTPWLERTYTSSSATSLTVSVNTTWLNIHQDNTVTLTLPNAATYPGKELIIKQTGSGVVLSSSQNIIGFTTAYNGATQTAIINPISRRYATLVSDGNYWVIMQVSN
jgi:hypothetical protein